MSQHKPAKWYEIRNEDSDEPEILIMDEIGDRGFWGEGVTAKGLVNQLKDLEGAKSIKVRINSPGGSVFDGNAIYNALVNAKADINVSVEGMAFSAASIIAMAGDRIDIAQNAMMMIHNPWAVVQGDAEDMERMVDLLGKIKKGIVDTYHNRTGMGKRKLAKMMSDETWMTADEAVDLGFADEVSGQLAVAASVDLDKFDYSKMPDQAKALFGEGVVISFSSSAPKTTTEDADAKRRWITYDGTIEDTLETISDTPETDSGDSTHEDQEIDAMENEKKVEDPKVEDVQDVTETPAVEADDKPEYSDGLLERAKALGMADLVLGLVLNGTPEDEIKDAMLDAKVKNTVKATAPAPVDQVEDTPAPEKTPETPDERWEANEDGVQNRFPDKRHFLALNRMRADGRVKSWKRAQKDN